MPRMRWLVISIAIALALTGMPLAAAGVPVETPLPVRHTGRVFAVGGQAGDAFGYSVAIDGNTAVVGAPYYDDEGAAFVYEYTDAGWVFGQKLPADPGIGDAFGYSVDIDGDVIVVGVPYGNSSAADETGLAVAYERGPGGWTYLSELAPEPASVNDAFGWSVAVSGDRAVVGSPRDDQIANDAGAMYIFTRGDPAYVKYMSSAAEAGTEYGTSVDIDGDYIITGAPKDDTAAGVDAGAVHFYHWDGAFWDYLGIRFGSSDDAGDRFGHSVSISGDRALVGALLDDVGTAIEAGSADAFTRSGTNWACTQTLVSPTPDTNDNFGRSVSLGGGFALVGVPLDDAYAGSAHAYRLVGSTWTLLGKLSPVATDSLAGFSVAASSLGRGVVGNAQGAGEIALTGSASFLANLEPVYRFYNPGAGTHFFTNSAGERDMVIATWPTIFGYEGPAYCTNPLNNAQPLYRFYKPSSSSHFYTADESERDSVIAALSHIYAYDGPTYPVTRYPEAGRVAVYRFYNLKNGSHFYTADTTERDRVASTLASVYLYEGPAFWLGQ